MAQDVGKRKGLNTALTGLGVILLSVVLGTTGVLPADLAGESCLVGGIGLGIVIIGLREYFRKTPPSEDPRRR